MYLPRARLTKRGHRVTVRTPLAGESLKGKTNRGTLLPEPRGLTHATLGERRGRETEAEAERDSGSVFSLFYSHFVFGFLVTKHFWNL